LDVDDLIDAAGVAALLGLSQRNSVRTYRTRYPSFPEPVVDMGAGRCLLWLRSEVQRWADESRPPVRNRRS
jgi:predicted DNA-binding transcriptional regulator AlpA